jgi:2-C-methyl-D-erythritol 4-phosphate cytidylyltransferase
VSGYLAVVLGNGPVSGPLVSWAGLEDVLEPGEQPVVVLDSPDVPVAAGSPANVVLIALAGAEPDVVVVSTMPVTDTLKVVDGEGTVLGTAERREHRLVGTPVAARLGLLRAVRPRLGTGVPTVIELLDALAAQGAVVVAAPYH